MIGMRAVAIPLRDKAEQVLLGGREVVFDFADVSVTQSFVDELIGNLILRHGPDLLERMIFSNCSDDTRAILEFVASDRADQYLSAHTH